MVLCRPMTVGAMAQTEDPHPVTADDQIHFAMPDVTERDVEAVARVLRSGWITTGHECLRLEEELASFLEVEHVVAMSSCTAALETAVAHLGLPRGARVGVPTWTFAASALAVAREGLQPVLLDVHPDTLNLSADALADAVEEGLDAVMAVHFAGVPVSLAVHDLCHHEEIPLIEDAAHALGATDHRGLVNGTATSGACFSFYATKNLTSGEGGALATDDPALAEFARTYRLHGMSRDAWARYHPGAESGYDVVTPGIKGNMPDLLAALARSQLTRFGEMQARRRELARRYRDNLAGTADIRVVPETLDERSADHLLVVILPEGTDRGAVRRTLDERRVVTSVHFEPLHHLRWFADNAVLARRGTPVADSLAPRALSLPLHSGLADREVDRVCEALIEAVRLTASA